MRSDLGRNLRILKSRISGISDDLNFKRNTIIQLSRVSVMKTLSCREAGFDCDYVVKGETEEEIFKNGAEHATREHGMKPEDITPQFKEKLRGLILNS